jgi:hypothetical protein
MKQSDRFNEVTTATRRNPDPTSDPKWIGKYRAAILGSSLMLVGLLGVYGCTKKSEQHVASLSQNPPAPSAPALPEATAIPRVAAKRKVQRTSHIAVYSNDAYGISFRYPRNYKLKTFATPSEEGQPTAMDGSIADPAEVPLATLQMPQNLYPGTDFSDGYFSVSANGTLTDAACQQSVVTNEDSKLMTEKINGLEFHWTENSSAEGLSSFSWRTYAAFANGTCYQAQYGFERAAPLVSEDKVASKDVKSTQVFGRLQTILSSLKIRPVATPAVEPAVRSFGEPGGAISNSVPPSITVVNGEAICPKCESSAAQAYLVAGTRVDIAGHGFQPNSSVWIGSISLAATTDKDSIHILLPESLPIGTYPLYVSSDSAKSDAVTVVVRPPVVEHIGVVAGESSEPVMNAAEQN